jgi:hypothetical protein
MPDDMTAFAGSEVIQLSKEELFGVDQSFDNIIGVKAYQASRQAGENLFVKKPGHRLRVSNRLRRQNNFSGTSRRILEKVLG